MSLAHEAMGRSATAMAAACDRRRTAAVVLGSAGCALSTTVWQMMGWRVVRAVGACAGPVLARAMVRDLYAREDLARMLSTLILIMAVAPLLGPWLGGQILAFWSWQGIFWLLAAVGLLTLVALLALPETLPSSWRTTAPLRHVMSEYLALVRNPGLISYALSGGFFYAGAYAFIAGTPFAYIEYHRLSPQHYGLLFGVNVVGIMAANFLNTRLVARVGSQRLFLAGTWIVAWSGVVMALDACFGWGGLAGLAVPVFVYMSMNGGGLVQSSPPRSGPLRFRAAGLLHTIMSGMFASSLSSVSGYSRTRTPVAL